jgi:excisionase family DNA binding protein
MLIDSDDMITQAEAARIRGVGHEAIRNLVRRGRFKVFKVGGKIFLSRKEVEAFKPRAGGRPRKKKPSKPRKRPTKG